MTTTPAIPDSPTGTRLMDAAAQLFYSDGVGVGVEKLCKTAGASKKSLYEIFGSKDDLMAASLARSIPTYLAVLLPRAEPYSPPRQRILALFDNLEAIISAPTFRGCPYVSASMEIKNAEHPARAVARGFHNTLTEYFRDAADEAGVDDPGALAVALTVVHDGVTSRAVVQNHADPGLGRAIATSLLGGAGVS
ncbi:TetR/AcrR family transcriptional regulator [Williamsia sp. M5A3_1d]